MGTTAAPEAVREALRRAAAAGPFFAVEVGRPADPPEGPPWRDFDELIDPTADGPPALAARVGATRAAVAVRAGLRPADVELRVAASLVHLNLAARLLSPALGAALLGGVVPHAAGLRWRDVLGGPVPLALPGPYGEAAGDPDDPAELADLLGAHVLDGPVGALTRALGTYARVSGQVLHGNVASALGGAVRMLRSVAPARSGTALGVWRHLLDRAPLTGSGTLTLVPAAGADPDADVPPGWSFVRANCCLYYRVPGGGICGDCVLSLRR